MAPRTPEKRGSRTSQTPSPQKVKKPSPLKLKGGSPEKSSRQTCRQNGSSYDIISKFTAKTRVKYVPNPKTPGSKSYVRYAKYEKAKTVGEALRHCKPADLFWEYERGYFQVLGGPMATTPACMAPPSDDPVVQTLAKFRGHNSCSIKVDPAVRAAPRTPEKLGSKSVQTPSPRKIKPPSPRKVKNPSPLKVKKPSPLKLKGGFAKKCSRQTSKRGTGLKFNAASYDLISKFTAKTRVKYVPNPKTPGSKSHVRYAKYEKAKTVGDALRHCKPADLLWEYERGYLQVLGGPMATTPACLAPPSDDPVIQTLAKFRGPNGCSIKVDPVVRAKLSALATEFGMDLDQIHEEAGKQCNSESADVQTARLVANEFARRKLALGRAIGDKDVVDVLSIWGFPDNDTRQNVLPEGVKSVHSDTLGVLKLRDGGYRIFDPTTRYEHVTRLLCQWFAASRKAAGLPQDFGFTGINVNHNYAGRRHRDNGNEGPSAIKAIGKFSGGKLNYFPKDFKRPGRSEVSQLPDKESLPLDLGKAFALFNGNNAHGVQPFKGERFSLVFFTTSKWHKMKDREANTLRELGFVVPTIKSMDKVKKVSHQQDLDRADRL